MAYRDFDDAYYDRPYSGGRRERGYGYRQPSYREDWRRPGPFMGVGPEGWKPTDERIEDEINVRLMQHGWIDAKDISLDVKDGIATFSGSVPSRREKWMVEEVAESVLGVVDIENELRVQKGEREGQS